MLLSDTRHCCIIPMRTTRSVYNLRIDDEYVYRNYSPLIMMNK